MGAGELLTWAKADKMVTWTSVVVMKRTGWDWVREKQLEAEPAEQAYGWDVGRRGLCQISGLDM